MISAFTDIPDLILACDPTTSATDAGSGKCSQWNDASGNGNHLTQGTDAKRPIIGTDAQGRYFDLDSASRQCFNLPAGVTWDSQALTVVMLGTSDLPTNGSRVWFNPGTSNGLAVPFHNSSRALQVIDGSSYAISHATHFSGVDDQEAVWWLRSGSALVDTGHNGTTSTLTAATLASETASGGTFGDYTGTTTAWDGKVRGIVCVARRVTDVELRDIRCLLMRKCGYSADVQVIVDGDSIAFGGRASGGQTHWAELLRKEYSDRIVLTNVAIPGNSVDDQDALADDRVDALLDNSFALNLLIFAAGSNDIAIDGQTGAQTEARIDTYCSNRRSAGWTGDHKIAVAAILPRTGANVNTRRNDANTALATNYTGYADYLIRVDQNANIGNDDDEDDVTYYVDAIHPTTAGHAEYFAEVDAIVGSLIEAAQAAAATPVFPGWMVSL